jgi:hypothetical protein
MRFRPRRRKALSASFALLCMGALLLIPPIASIAGSPETGVTGNAAIERGPALGSVNVAALRARRDPFAPPSGELDGSQEPNDRAATIVVRAVALGPRPVALVDKGGRTTLLGVGDGLENSTVSRITADRIILADGNSIFVAGAQP